MNLAIVGFVQPYARYAYEGLRFELRSGALGASIKVGEFTHLGKRMTMRIEKSSNNGRDLSGIFVMGEGKDGKTLAVTAEKGTFLATDDPDTIILRLANGVLVLYEPVYGDPSALTPPPAAVDATCVPWPLQSIGSLSGTGALAPV